MSIACLVMVSGHTLKVKGYFATSKPAGKLLMVPLVQLPPSANVLLNSTSQLGNTVTTIDTIVSMSHSSPKFWCS